MNTNRAILAPWTHCHNSKDPFLSEGFLYFILSSGTIPQVVIPIIRAKCGHKGHVFSS